MTPVLVFWITFAVISLLIFLADRYFFMLRNSADPTSGLLYSWSRVQLAWWTLIVMASFTTIVLVFKQAPDLNTSTLILLGISSVTIATARTIDVTAANNNPLPVAPVPKATNFFVDILSDQTGVSIPRFQTVLFNAVFGVWFIAAVLEHLVQNPGGGMNAVMPEISTNNLILLGLSSATYAALKTTENKSAAISAANNSDSKTKDS